jgi:Zn-finger nucleic acid-binding protein
MENKSSKTCPGCGGILEEVYASATYGRVLLLDQCPACGGVWFDRWELYFLGPGEAKRLESIDPAAIATPNPLKKGLGMCPLCAVGLSDFNDPALPPDACIKRCPQCSGLWLNRGELARYEEHRARLRGTAPVPTGAALPPPGVKTLKNLQKALDTSAVSRPWSRPLPEESYAAPLTAREVAEDLAPIILRILFNIIFHRIV